MVHKYFQFVLTLLLVCGQHAWASDASDLSKMSAHAVRRVAINPLQPEFIPVHPRVATTIRFPASIGDPMGAGFLDAEEIQKASADGKPVQSNGEYVITYLQGDNFFTVRPLPRAGMMNLNVPCEGMTIVLYFMPVESPADAVASLEFVLKGASTTAPAKVAGATETESKSSFPAGTQRIIKTDTRPESPYETATPARIDGLLGKLKLVHASRPGEELDEISQALGLQVSVSSAEGDGFHDITRPLTDSGVFQLILLRAVRDPHIDSVGFIFLMRNTSDHELVFDLRSLSARAGAALYTARAIEAPANLKPGQVMPGYFVVVGNGNGSAGHLLSNNDWHLSINLVSEKNEPAGQLLKEAAAAQQKKAGKP